MEITKIPLRKNMKGEQVGKAVIDSFVYDYLHQNRPDYRPLYTPEDLQRMIGALPTQYERHIYSEYIGLYSGIVGEFDRAQGKVQQAQNGFFLLKTALSDVWQALLAQAWLQNYRAAASNTETPAQLALIEEFDALFTGLPTLMEDAHKRRELLDAKELFLYPALQLLHAYNTLLELIAAAFGLPHLLYLQADLTALVGQILEYNGQHDDVLALLAPFEEDTLDALLPKLEPQHGSRSDEAEQSVAQKLKNPENYAGGSLLRLLEELMG